MPQRPRHLLYPSYATIAVLLLALTLPVYHAPRPTMPRHSINTARWYRRKG